MGSRSLKTSPFERAVIAVLKERLQNADLTIDRLAERAGITRARCYKIFSGTAICTVTDFCAMCNVLGIAGSAVAAEAEQRLVGERVRGRLTPRPTTPSLSAGPRRGMQSQCRSKLGGSLTCRELPPCRERLDHRHRGKTRLVRLSCHLTYLPHG